MAAIHHQQHTSLRFLLLLLLTAAGASGVAAGGGAPYLIKSTCAAVTNSTWHTPYRYCVRTLSAYPAAASAKEARGLAAAAANLTVTNVTSTMLILTELMDSLQMCVALYKSMNRSVVGALDDLRVGRLDAAWPKIKDASYQPNYCELALMEGNSNKDPVREENDGNQLLSGMANDIMELIAPIPPS